MAVTRSILFPRDTVSGSLVPVKIYLLPSKSQKMVDEPSLPDPPEDLPTDVREALAAHATDPHILQETVLYAQELLNVMHEETLPIEPAEGEEIVRVEEKPEYFEVVKRFEGNDDAYLYHVQPEPHPDDRERLRWRLIGRVETDE